MTLVFGEVGFSKTGLGKMGITNALPHSIGYTAGMGSASFDCFIYVFWQKLSGNNGNISEIVQDRNFLTTDY